MSQFQSHPIVNRPSWEIPRLKMFVHLSCPLTRSRISSFSFQPGCRSLCWRWQMVSSMDQIDVFRTKTRHGVLRGFWQWEFSGLCRYLFVSGVGSIVAVAGHSYSSDGRDDGVWRIDNLLEARRIELHLDQNRRSLQRFVRRKNQVGLHGRRRLGCWVTIVNSRRTQTKNCGRDTSRVRESLVQRDAFSICSSSSSICKSSTSFGNFGFEVILILLGIDRDALLSALRTIQEKNGQISGTEIYFIFPTTMNKV